MKQISIEIYKAFAQTKPTEFDSFHRDWITEHATIEEVVEIQPKRRRTLKPKAVVSDPTEDDGEQLHEELIEILKTNEEE